jgi:glycosyltransferase involved in cell wall biosynthesis
MDGQGDPVKINNSESATPVALVSDRVNGGAAIACCRLYHGVVSLGSDARWIALGDERGKGASLASDWIPGRVLVLQRLMSRFISSEKWSWRLQAELNNITLSEHLRKKKWELINLHNVHDGVSFGLLSKLPKRLPVVWTLHDMWPLTGYCCYSYSCGKYEDGCTGECPQAHLWGRMSKSPENGWLARQSFYRRNLKRLHFVSPSRWLAGCARARLHEEVSVSVIPYGVPLDVFKPARDKRAVRLALGLPLEGSIVLCGAQNIDDARKGTRYLMQAIEMLNKRRREAVTVVAFGNAPKGSGLPADWIHTGTIRDEALLNLYYSSADVFVLPSLADNLPNTLIEATAAGTPCVTSDVGGCPDIVREGETGFVAKQQDAEDLAQCIEKVLEMDNERWRQMSVTCRRVAVAEYDVKLQAQRYLELFVEMISRAAPMRNKK